MGTGVRRIASSFKVDGGLFYADNLVVNDALKHILSQNSFSQFSQRGTFMQFWPRTGKSSNVSQKDLQSKQGGNTNSTVRVLHCLIRQSRGRFEPLSCFQCYLGLQQKDLSSHPVLLTMFFSNSSTGKKKNAVLQQNMERLEPQSDSYSCLCTYCRFVITSCLAKLFCAKNK